ncbi:phosphotransferase [Streptomyces sp. TX20-6-3]|uniref:phosphotransferase n=1 Tax=Streptomyces sp. TX20-6-3 TaxID=3028705 RepID=UPI0029AE1E34|nr:phosphotransferase [Streptomyces sp. TX20-6-3]MDX2563725.1 phosphotransferase [Streptomyces sp. TX20-6-3]
MTGIRGDQEARGVDELEIIGWGRTADVYALPGDGAWVLRRNRDGGGTAREAEVMTRLARQGYPVPAVLRAEGPDLVMERLTGPSLLDALLAGTYAPEPAGALIAELLTRLHALPGAPAHLDLHPGNVLLTAGRGPVVIDWETAEEGHPPGLDHAMSALILAEVAVSPAPYAPGARAGLAALLSAATAPVLPYVGTARIRRAADPHLTEGEVAALGAATELVTELAAA